MGLERSNVRAELRKEPVTGIIIRYGQDFASHPGLST